MNEEQVILVDVLDQQIGTMPKQKAHIEGKLHRAFSVFVFNDAGELLLQQRAFDKYHSPGKWTNTCCSHPRSGEDTLVAANRRLKEEMGMACQLKWMFSFTYHAEFENGLIEHEFDHVYFGHSGYLPIPDKAEVADFRYMTMESLKEELAINPNDYTPWFKICFDQVMLNYIKYQKNG